MVEKDIFSIDSDGNVIVNIVIGDSEEILENNNIVSDYVWDLPNTSRFERIRKEPYDYSDWDNYAKKGITAYDDFNGENILTSVALNPLKAVDLPDDIYHHLLLSIEENKK